MAEHMFSAHVGVHRLGLRIAAAAAALGPSLSPVSRAPDDQDAFRAISLLLTEFTVATDRQPLERSNRRLQADSAEPQEALSAGIRGSPADGIVSWSQVSMHVRQQQNDVGGERLVF